MADLKLLETCPVGEADFLFTTKSGETIFARWKKPAQSEPADPAQPFVPAPTCPRCGKPFAGLVVCSMQLPNPGNPQGDPVLLLATCPQRDCQAVIVGHFMGYTPRQVARAGPQII